MTLKAAAPEYFTVGPVPSGGTAVYSGVLVQLDGTTPIAPGMLQTLTLTLVDDDTNAVINSRDGQNVLNVPGTGVTVDVTLGTGALQWVIGAGDNVFLRVDPPPEQGDVEKHAAVFKWTWISGGNTYQSSRKVFIDVESYVDFNVPPGGDGVDQVTGVVSAPDGVLPVDDARVWATTDSAGATRAAGPVFTDPLGQFLLMLDPGAYFLWVNSPAFAVPAGIAFTVPIAAPMAVELAYKTGSDVMWTSRKELEVAFGKSNVSRWADTENTDNAQLIGEVIQAAVADATDEAKSMVDNSACGTVVVAPRALRRNVTRLAAGLLYEARGTRDTASDDGANRLRSSVAAAYKYFKRVAAGNVHLDGCIEPVGVPFVVPHLVRHGGLNGPLLTQEQTLYANEREELMGVPTYRWFYGDGFDLAFMP